MGTVLPYLCVVSGLKILSASTASIFGMIEPVLAGMFAWWWLNESLNAIQLLGCVVVIVWCSRLPLARPPASPLEAYFCPISSANKAIRTIRLKGNVTPRLAVMDKDGLAFGSAIPTAAGAAI